jgi:hypothetical protein
MRHPLVPPELCVGPFTLESARRAGLTRRHLATQPWRHICRDVYVHGEIPDTLELRLAVVRLILPAHAVVSGTSAAWLHGVDIRGQNDPIEVTARRGVTLQPRGTLLRPRQALLPLTDVMEINGVPVTTPLRTAFDLCRLQSLTEAVVGLDAMTHAGLVTLDDLVAYADGHHRWRGVRQVMESRLRMAIVLEGTFPRPVVQLVIRDRYGRFICRVDLAFPVQRVVLEYDGLDHETAGRGVRDARRHNRLVAAQWFPLYVTATQFYQGRAQIFADLHRALRDLGPANIIQHG